MNKPEKVLMFSLIVILVSSASLFGFLIGYYHVQVDIDRTMYHEIWIDSESGEIVAYRTLMVMVVYRDKEEIVWYEHGEVYRSEYASETIQWTVDHSSGIIFVLSGTYNITKTLVLDSQTKLYGTPRGQTQFNSEVDPIIIVPHDAEEVVISSLNVTMNERKQP